MCSENWFFPILRFCILSSTLHLANFSFAEEDTYWSSHCSSGRPSYTKNSTYQHNLDAALSSLNKTNNGYGYFSSSAGEGSGNDTAYAMAICRGDVHPESCLICVNDVVSRIRNDCPEQKEATGWYENCILSYSDISLLEPVDDKNRTIPGCNFEHQLDQAEFSSLLRTLFNDLQGDPGLSDNSLRKYASNSMTKVGFSSIFGYMQCNPEATESECKDCLAEATQAVQESCSDSTGGRLYLFRCTVRYETYSFFHATWYPPPPPPSPPPPPQDPGRRSVSKILSIGSVLAALTVTAILLFLICRMILRIQKRKEKYSLPDSEAPSSAYPAKLRKGDAGEMNYFKLSTIQDSTNNFSLANKLGEGGFGPVYKGKLVDGREIAVKRLSRNSGQGLEEFKMEVNLIVKLQHKNLVRLLGCCTKGIERLLVYEYMANGSLDSFLFDPAKCKEMDWVKRANIVCGIAKGLRYLHEDSRLKIVHRDMKASNVLLDKDMNPKISDFGTARIFGADQVDANTKRVIGTYGYMAPEYAMEGLFSTKSDVYSFGVLLLEVICGQRNSRLYDLDHNHNLLSYACKLWKEGKGEQLIDRNKMEDCPVSEVLRWMHIALLCTQEEPEDRPSMSSVIFMLEGEWTSLPELSEPPLSFTKFSAADRFLPARAGIGLTSSDDQRSTGSMF